MSRLHLAFLGHPEVHHGEQSLTFRTRKTLALLIYLVVEGGMHSRDRLTALFWPESDRSAGRANLRSTLMYLRKALSHEGEGKPGHLIVERRALGFNAESDYDLDLEIVEAAAGDGDEDVLQRAVDLCRGEFLEGFSLPDAVEFDDWVTLQREAWHLRLNALFDRLSQQRLDSGDPVAAARVLREWLALNSLEERAYRRLMRAQFQQGDRGGALQTFALGRKVLAEELGVEPSPETVALAERIRESRLEVVDDGRQTDPARRVLSELPLMGRAEEHRALAGALRRVEAGQHQIVTVEGEAGIGKSRLTRAFLDWARAQGAQILKGRAYETGGRLPYQPVVDAIRPLFAGEAPRPDLSPAWLAELSRLLPELRDRWPDLPEPAGEEATASTRLFEAVARLGVELAARRPLVLLIDDVQWADAASLDLLLYASRRWSEEEDRLLLLLAVRSGVLGHVGSEAAVLRDWLHKLRRGVPNCRVQLGALSPDVTRELAEKLTLSDGAEAFGEWLYRETGGQPFYIAETLEALLEEGVVRPVQDERDRWRLDVSAIRERGNGDQSLIPPGVRELIRHRLARLTTGAFNLLAAAAVLGQEAPFRRLCRVAGQDEAAGLAAMDELTGARLLEERQRPARTTTYSFSHDKIRDVVYTEAGDARRQLFHERAFSRLEEEGAPPARLAHHALQAGRAPEAFVYHLAAGDEAMELFAVRDAIDFYERAQRLIQEEPAVQDAPEQRQRLFERLGRAYELENRWPEAGAIYHVLLDYARSEERPQMEIAALNRLAGVTIHGDWQPQQAIDYLQQSRAIATAEEDTAGLVEIAFTHSRVLYMSLEREAAVAHAERALELARETGKDELVARSLNYLAYARFGIPSALPQIEADAAEARALFARVGNRALEADSLTMVAHAQIHSGRPFKGLENGREAQAIVREIENSWGQVNVAFNLAFALVEVGRLQEALAVAEEGVSVARRHGHDTLLANALSVRGIVHRALGAPGDALADHEAAQERFAELPFALVPAIIAVHLCADCALAGDWERAHAYARQSLEVEDLTWLWAWSDTGFFYHHVVEALARAGEGAQAQEALSRFRRAVGDNARYRIPYLQARAALAEQEGDEETAAILRREAEEIARSITAGEGASEAAE
ncbi:MAG: AAA family ATPase [Candidatus Promineifilaceae bacterium]|nr:AAA family ATPase [Candidatus Promineifilaceae bacterium]